MVILMIGFRFVILPKKYFIANAFWNMDKDNLRQLASINNFCMLGRQESVTPYYYLIISRE